MDNTTNQISIENKIYELRGIAIMLDQDLAVLFQVETKILNKSAKRNIERFPTHFMFQLTNEEWNNLRFQIGTSSETYGGRRFLPYAFTEQGVAMLSAILRSEIAIKVSIQIMDAFVSMRKLIRNSKHIEHRLTQLENKNIKTIHDRFLLIDENEVYHFGASLKDLGKKWFAFSRLNDFASVILNRIKE
jgi:hypothetical protein